ncbi:hypothetical protein HCA58_17500 [Micromonospora sp. HNM0581]|uniref:hypothetical protein n=1 Tax=Micromonospora sp. HNM0581 TaxID=2716341 RepID=UPI001469F002|nr:hypothetical protein [Micromonospora sp. HNM0581]NLU80142.1 hypothetical protein [Micromonospora sp. HNM0581]
MPDVEGFARSGSDTTVTTPAARDSLTVENGLAEYLNQAGEPGDQQLTDTAARTDASAHPGAQPTGTSDDGRVVELLRSLPPYQDGSDDCVTRLREMRRGLFGPPARSVDDLTGPEHLRLAEELGGVWSAVADGVPLANALRGGGPGSTAFVLFAHAGGLSGSRQLVRHGAMVRHFADGSLRWVETQSAVDGALRPFAESEPLPLDALVIALRADGSAVQMQAGRARLDAPAPPAGPKYGMNRAVSQDDIATELTRFLTSTDPVAADETPAEGAAEVASTADSTRHVEFESTAGDGPYRVFDDDLATPRRASRKPTLPTIDEIDEIALDEDPGGRENARELLDTSAEGADDEEKATLTPAPTDEEKATLTPAPTDEEKATLTPAPTDEEKAALTAGPADDAEVSQLRGLYRDRPDLLTELDAVNNLDVLVSEVTRSVRAAVGSRAAQSSWIAATVPKLSIDTSGVERALRDELRTFFTSGGRSFFVRDGLHRWHRVTIRPVWDPMEAEVIDQAEDKAKFDTRSDWSEGSKQGSAVGSSGAVSIGVMFPQRLGYGAGGSIDVSLSRPSETYQDSVKVTDSHNVRSGSGSHLVFVPVDFEVLVTDPNARLTGPEAASAVRGESVRAGLTLRGVDDIANASRRRDAVHVDPAKHTSMLTEHFTPVLILGAAIDAQQGDRRTDPWNDVTEDILLRLQPTKTVSPGSVGMEQARRMFEDSSMVGNLIPAMESAGHPSTILSEHGSHALSVNLKASVIKLSAIADIAKSSFRWQPGLVGAASLSQLSRVGAGFSLIPARWGFGPAYFQARFSASHLRSTETSVSHGGTSRLGTEAKDVPNVLVEAQVRVTIDAGLREVPLSRMPFGDDGAVGPITIDMVVLGRLPASRFAQMQNDANPFHPSPTQWHVPSYAQTGGRAVTYGLSDFHQLYFDVTGLVRRFRAGFLPRFGEAGKVSSMGSSRAAIERQSNQDELDGVLTVSALRQGMRSLLGRGLVAELSRTKPFGTQHLVVHVTGRYLSPLSHLGTSRQDAVRTVDVSTSEHKIGAGGQWRAAVAGESGKVLRFTGSNGRSAALVPAGAFEYRRRISRQSYTKLAGNESRLVGGTPDSEAFDTKLEIAVTVYAYTSRLGFDSNSRLGVARVLRQRLPRPATTDQDDTTVVRSAQERVPAAAGGQFTRFRMTQARPVTVQFDAASVARKPVSLPVVLTPHPDPLGVARRTQLRQPDLRGWVDSNDGVDVHDWLAIEALPGSASIAELATVAIGAVQSNAHYSSRTRLRGLRGNDGMVEGMPLWATLLQRSSQFRQRNGLAAMLNGVWLMARLTNTVDGAATDVAFTGTLTNAKLVPTAHVPVFTETASTGSVEVSADRRVEDQFGFRSIFSATMRRLGINTDGTNSGGALASAGHEKLLYAGGRQESESVSGAIERNLNNRAGKNRSFVVAFDLRASVSVEVTTNPARYRIIPQALRSGSWLHHYKSIQRHGTISNAVVLRLPAPAVVKLGLLAPLSGDPGAMGAPWVPPVAPTLELPAGHGSGLGLHIIHQAPNLTRPMTAALATEAARATDERSMLRRLYDVIRSEGSELAAGKIFSALSDPGLDDVMLNRQRLLHLFSRDGVRQHWPSLVDGGLSVLHVKPARTTQHLRDVRLVAETIGTPVFMGFVADHNDLDIKTTRTTSASGTRHRLHGHLFTAGAAGTGVSNHHGENFAAGAGDTVGRAFQERNSQSTSSSRVESDLSSARGVKVRLALPVRFALVVYDRGKRIDSDLLAVEDTVIQDRWANDVRLPRASPVPRPTTYGIRTPDTLPPGWRTLNGLPLPPRFSAEDLSRAARLQDAVERLLSDTARRLRLPGYAGSHQVHQSLTPELLLPAVSAMLTSEGLHLPSATSAQILGQRAEIVIRLLPEAASLQGISSKVYREHVVQEGGEYSSGTAALTQNLRGPRVPLLGRGNVDDPYQPLENGGMGAIAGDSHAATESGSSTTGGFSNIKPESRSALIDYFCRIEVEVKLSYSLFPSRTVTEVDPANEPVIVSLRMGLHDARLAIDVPADGTRSADFERATAFATVIEQEAALSKAADAFVAAADRLDQARYDSHAAAGDDTRAVGEADLPALVDAWNEAGRIWWELAQRHYQLVGDFRDRFLGVPPRTSPADALRLAEYVQHLSNSRIEEVTSPADELART